MPPRLTAIGRCTLKAARIFVRLAPAEKYGLIDG